MPRELAFLFDLIWDLYGVSLDRHIIPGTPWHIALSWSKWMSGLWGRRQSRKSVHSWYARNGDVHIYVYIRTPLMHSPVHHICLQKILERVKFQWPCPNWLRMSQISVTVSWLTWDESNFGDRVLIDLGRVKCRPIKLSLLWCWIRTSWFT
jgi:hypothetical protein